MPFEKGQSGNPLGRRVEFNRVRAKAQEQGERAIETQVALLDDPDPKVRLAASNALLDRGFGKPTQNIDADIRGEVKNWTVSSVAPSEPAPET